MSLPTNYKRKLKIYKNLRILDVERYEIFFSRRYNNALNSLDWFFSVFDIDPFIDMIIERVQKSLELFREEANLLDFNLDGVSTLRRYIMVSQILTIGKVASDLTELAINTATKIGDDDEDVFYRFMDKVRAEVGKVTSVDPLTIELAKFIDVYSLFYTPILRNVLWKPPEYDDDEQVEIYEKKKDSSWVAAKSQIVRARNLLLDNGYVFEHLWTTSFYLPFYNKRTGDVYHHQVNIKKTQNVAKLYINPFSSREQLKKALTIYLSRYYNFFLPTQSLCADEVMQYSIVSTPSPSPQVSEPSAPLTTPSVEPSVVPSVVSSPSDDIISSRRRAIEEEIASLSQQIDSLTADFQSDESADMNKCFDDINKLSKEKKQKQEYLSTGQYIRDVLQENSIAPIEFQTVSPPRNTVKAPDGLAMPTSQGQFLGYRLTCTCGHTHTIPRQKKYQRLPSNLTLCKECGKKMNVVELHDTARKDKRDTYRKK